MKKIFEHLITHLNTKTKRTASNDYNLKKIELSAKMLSQEEVSQILRNLLCSQEIEDQHNRMVYKWRFLALTNILRAFRAQILFSVSKNYLNFKKPFFDKIRIKMIIKVHKNMIRTQKYVLKRFI